MIKIIRINLSKLHALCIKKIKYASFDAIYKVLFL
jgi:hypothetical protein